MLRRPFGRDERGFVLKVRGWREVEKHCDAGLGEIAARLAPLVQLIEIGAEGIPGGFLAAVAQGQLGRARLDDVREPILQGLIDGEGLTETEAAALVRAVFDPMAAAGGAPMLQYASLAFSILAQALIGLKDEPPGEPSAAA